MKKEVETLEKKQKKLGDLHPLEQERVIKQEIGKRIRQSELTKIRNMTISQINQVADKQVDPPTDQSRLNKIRYLNSKLQVTEDMLEHNVKTPGQRHVQLMQKSQALRRKIYSQYKKDPVMSQIKRGKLGVDNFFIIFGIFGSLMIPVYIFQKFKQNRQNIIKSRIASPQVIRRLDEDSPISLQDVNYHTIHYYNPERNKEREVKKRLIEQREKLQRELYF